jgi:hypothetical protein
MSAATETRPAVLEGERIPFLRHVRIELRKTVDTRASAWLLIAIAAITVGATVLPLFLSDDGSGLDWASFVLFASSGWSFLLPFIGVLAATSEWTQRTALSTFTLEPRRTLVNLAKLVASLVLGVAMVAATYAAGAVVNANGSGSWRLDGGVVLGYLGTMAIYVTLGVGLGLLLLNTPLAIVAFIVLPMIMGVLTLIPALADIVPWIDLTGASLPLVDGSLTGTEWAHLATAFLLWCALPMLLGLYRTSHREVA